jgi:hypothetical protein
LSDVEDPTFSRSVVTNNCKGTKLKTNYISGHENEKSLNITVLGNRLTDGVEAILLTHCLSLPTQDESWYSFLAEVKRTPEP